MPGYKLISPPIAEPVSLDTAKLWLKQDDPTDDNLIIALITAARDLCETYTGRAFVTQTWEMVMDAFPGYLDYRSGAAESVRTISAGAWFFLGMRWGFALPFSPVQSIVSFTYNDAFGNPQDLTSGIHYVADLVSNPARIFPVFDTFWPLTQYAPNAVVVQFVCGFGAPYQVPEAIQQAILFLVSYWYNNRDAVVVTSGVAREMPMVVMALLSQYRDVRF